MLISCLLAKEVFIHIMEPLTHIVGRSMETAVAPKYPKRQK